MFWLWVDWENGLVPDYYKFKDIMELLKEVDCVQHAGESKVNMKVRLH